jgi:hypothetical protein
MKICSINNSSSRLGILLIECMIYIALFSVILTLAFAAFFRGLTGSRNLQKNASDISNTLQAGERWRDDVRSARLPPTRVETTDGSALEIRQQTNTVIYIFSESSIYRLQNTNAPWVKLLSQVKSSNMEKELRNETVAWHWNIELNSNQKTARVRPLFTFCVVPLLENK